MKVPSAPPTRCFYTTRGTVLVPTTSERLGNIKVISPETAEHMSELAKFRNLLVQLYWKVDNARVVGMLSQTPSITKYLREIAAFCKL